MKRGSKYLEAILWIARNDDNEWLFDEGQPSVTAVMVADLFGKSQDQVKDDLEAAVKLVRQRAA